MVSYGNTQLGSALIKAHMDLKRKEQRNRKGARSKTSTRETEMGGEGWTKSETLDGHELHRCRCVNMRVHAHMLQCMCAACYHLELLHYCTVC